MRVEKSAEEVVRRKERERRSFVSQHQGLEFPALLEMSLPKTFTKHDQGLLRAGMSIIVLQDLRNPRKSMRQLVLASVSPLNVDLPLRLLIQALLRVRGIQLHCLLLPVQPRYPPLPALAGILRELVKEGVTVRVVTYPVFTLVAMACSTRIVQDRLPLVRKLWKRIVFLPFRHCQRICQIIVHLHIPRTGLAFLLLEWRITRLTVRSLSRFRQPRSLPSTLTRLILTSQ